MIIDIKKISNINKHDKYHECRPVATGLTNLPQTTIKPTFT